MQSDFPLGLRNNSEKCTVASEIQEVQLQVH